MKNLITIITITMLIVACSSNTTSTQSKTDSTNVENVISDSLCIEMDSVNAEICNDSII